MRKTSLSLLCAALLPLVAACGSRRESADPPASAPQPVQTASAAEGKAAGQSVADNPRYTRNLNHPFVSPLDILFIYFDTDPKAATDPSILKKAEDKSRELVDEYRRTGKIALDGPDYGNPAALAEFRIRLGAQADLGYSIFGVGRVSFQTDETGRVLTAERDISDAEGYTRLKYSYWNGQPFSLALQYAGADKQEGIQTFIYVNRQWLPLRPETPLPAAYRNCAACTDEAHALLAEKEKLANGESPEQAALAHATAAAKRNIGLIDKRDLPELMIEGATKNSLTLGHDEEGRPEKLYYSFGDSRRVHSYQFYFRDGSPVSAEASTIFYRPDGSIDTGKTGYEQKILFAADGSFEKNDTANPPPERPISAKSWREETQRMIRLAGQYR
ncbi:hypothetical protein HMPREF9120_00583 [Neisseria sp. oral taxon 020 str. F0370]|uniref:hypothetical protein n=1 Tax=unclassified Neisseria TaxID=2623750 RepID=UPI0002A46F8C|nr:MULTISPECIES: hypothetical protein [unclassified Neisseria]ASP16607.1 hypothetical protein CGZ77_01975 [Neisseria sp. KEM232]EKY08924.1 hypothetical protein HMPREF9120_00583 [Neisseria sp. oral taxon 020 str. F0370]